MSVERRIGDMIRTIAQEKKDSVYAAVVKSVEGNTCTVELVSDGRELQNVSLNLVAENKEENGLLITPVKKSQVLIASVNEYNWFVFQYSQIEKVTLNATKKVVINAAEKIEINGGENGGLCITPELKIQLDKMTARIDDIIDALKNSAIGSSDGGALYKTNISLALAAITQKEDFSNIENANVTH